MPLEPAPVKNDLFPGRGDVARHMRALDWAATPLGPPDSWSHSLRSTVRLLLTSSYAMWMGWGPDLTFFYNDAYSPTLGVKHPWALSQPAREVWREIWGDIGPLIDQVLSTGEAIFSDGLLLFLERSGFPEETYHTFSYSPLFEDDGAVNGMLCVVVEETNRVLNERRLDTLREFATAAAAVTSEAGLCEAIVQTLGKNLKDLPFTLTYFGEADGVGARLAASTGLADAPGADVWPLDGITGVQFLVVDDLARRFGAVPSGNWDKPPEKAIIVPIGQGAEKPAGYFIVGLNPYRRDDGNLTGFIELLGGQIASALTGVRAYEEERRRAEALAEIDRAKTAFFSNVSHEFRTPLTLMLGPLEEALAGQVPDQARGQVELAHRNGLRLLRLVNSLLDFSRIEAGRVQATYESSDIARFSADIASSFRSAVEKAGLTLRIDVRPVAAPVYLDHDMWEKILLNLLSNAFKFTFEGEIAVEVAPSADGGSVIVAVKDSGIGIAEDELPRLFERFHRVEGAQGRSFEGSGIGLALVQELVKLHGGDIAVSSRLGHGTTFTVTVPTGKAHLPADRIRDRQTPETASKSNPFVEEALRWIRDEDEGGLIAAGDVADAADIGAGKTVILADDNADMRDYVRRLLEARGYRVQAFDNGQDAFDAARRSRPDLILSDVMMPKLDGFGLLRALRGEDALAGVPVILLSARAGEEAKVEGLDAGADDYLVKPFAARELLARVNANIQLAAVRRDAERRIIASEQKYQMTHDRLDLALSSGRVSVFDWDVDSDRAYVHGPLSRQFGVAPEDAEHGLPLQDFLAGIDPDDLPGTISALNASVADGRPYETEYRTHGGGDVRTILARGQAAERPDGVKRMSGVLIDLTHEKAAEQALRQKQGELEEQTRALGVLNRAAETISGNLDVEQVVQAITDAGVELSGAQFGAFFYNVMDDKGEWYTLYTLSGVPRAAFEKFPMPRNTDVFAPTFSGESVVRSDDILKDPRYGHNAPHKGMPEGHLPVRSYLAASVKSRDGSVMGGLFFGHPETGVFSQRAEDLISGLAAQAAVAIDNAQLFQSAQREIAQRIKAEDDLHLLNTHLEARVAAEIAERSRIEDALRQAQKMEAVGQLTGGVAHDFNNLLTVIIGGLDTIKRAKPEDSARILRAADMALQGAQRAASLTGRLLAFSRRQPLAPKPLELNLLVRDMTELLHRTLGEPIELEGVLAPRLWLVEADQNQLESAIINLAVNARDAMPEGGKLTIETANTALDEGYASVDSEVIPGQYVAISVSDTGHGMAADTLARVFEPFFTTKEVGRGTGLGLSQVYGFVKQSGGHVTVYSEPGQGTTVKMYFPRYLGGAVEIEAEAGVVPAGSDGEVILLVEDNDEVRAYSAMILGELGYEILEAPEAETALVLLRTSRRIDLLFTDVVLPGRSGRSLADEAATIRPGLKVLFTTGYSRNAIVHHGRLDPGVQLITKPFTFEQLGTRVRDILDLG